jgi:hypothetical protein
VERDQSRVETNILHGARYCKEKGGADCSRSIAHPRHRRYYRLGKDDTNGQRELRLNGEDTLRLSGVNIDVFLEYCVID